MGRLLRRVAIPVLILLLCVAYALSGRGHEDGRLIDAQGRRIFVADGDTLKIDAETIRLAGMDAVERAQFCTDAQGTAWSCGQAALTVLTEMVAKGGLRCVTIERDRYGRMVARCTVAGTGDLGAAMVAAGWAVADGGRYDALEKAARAAKRGIWAGGFEAPRFWRERHRVEPKRAGQVVGHP